MVVEKAQGAEMEAQFVEQTKRLREVQGVSQGQLASRMAEAGWLYWRQATVSRIEKGERTVRLAEAHDIARILGLSLARMLTMNEEVQNQNIGDTERLRALDDEISRLNESIGPLMAQVAQLQTKLNQVSTERGRLVTSMVGITDSVTASLSRGQAGADVAGSEAGHTQQAVGVSKAWVEEDYARQRQQDDDLTRAEARDGINPEA